MIPRYSSGKPWMQAYDEAMEKAQALAVFFALNFVYPYEGITPEKQVDDFDRAVRQGIVFG